MEEMVGELKQLESEEDNKPLKHEDLYQVVGKVDKKAEVGIYLMSADYIYSAALRTKRQRDLFYYESSKQFDDVKAAFMTHVDIFEFINY